jgi:hypothetical protein
MTLDCDEIKALAVAIVDEQERRNSIRMTAEYGVNKSLDQLRTERKLQAQRMRRRATK